MNKSVIVTVPVLLSAAVLLSGSQDNPHGQLTWGCVECHSTESWNHLGKDMKFDHNETGFRLDGAHRDVSCRSCHEELVFSHVGTACADCHADHHLGQLGNACENCHITRDWRPQTDLLREHAERGFPLTGVHAVADCEACHRAAERQEFVGTPTDCESCHRSDLTDGVDPDHSALAFSTDCRRCHQAAFGSWAHTTYEHPGSFPITGAHLAADCSACHAQIFAGTPTDCYGCHETDYQAASNPDHQQGGFSTTCSDCHSTNAWQPAAFDHTTTAFPLEGRHISASCIACHQTTYAGTPTTCYACHQNDYEISTDPSHLAAQFPTTCDDCHTPSGWSPASWDHDNQYFPVYSGPHKDKWTDCVECHTIPGSFSTFDCTACHEHNQTDMDNKHSQVQDYVYASSGCYNCHPTGRH